VLTRERLTLLEELGEQSLLLGDPVGRARLVLCAGEGRSLLGQLPLMLARISAIRWSSS